MLAYRHSSGKYLKKAGIHCHERESIFDLRDDSVLILFNPGPCFLLLMSIEPETFWSLVEYYITLLENKSASIRQRSPDRRYIIMIQITKVIQALSILVILSLTNC